MAIALTGNKFSIRPSTLLQIEDDLLALDFDMACAIRLRADDIEQDAKQALMGFAGVTGVDRSQPIALDA